MAGRQSVKGAGVDEGVGSLVERIKKHVVNVPPPKAVEQPARERRAQVAEDGVEERVVRTKNVLRPAVPVPDEQSSLDESKLQPVPERLVAPVAAKLGLDRENVAMYLALRNSGVTTFKATKQSGIRLLDGRNIDGEIARRQEESYNLPTQDELAETLAALEPGDMGGLVERLELTLRVVEHCQRTPLAVKTYKRALEALAEGLVSAGEMITEPDNSEMITAAVAAVSENEDALIAEQKKASAATSKAAAPERAKRAPVEAAPQHGADDAGEPAPLDRRQVKKQLRHAQRLFKRDEAIGDLLYTSGAPAPEDIHVAMQAMLRAVMPALRESGQFEDAESLEWEELLTVDLDDSIEGEPIEGKEYIAHLPLRLKMPRFAGIGLTDLRLTMLIAPAMDEDGVEVGADVMFGVGDAHEAPVDTAQAYLGEEWREWAIVGHQVGVDEWSDMEAACEALIHLLLDGEFGVGFMDEDDGGDDEGGGDSDEEMTGGEDAQTAEDGEE